MAIKKSVLHPTTDSETPYPSNDFFRLWRIPFNEDMEPEKGKIEKMTDRTADVIVEKIKTPIDRARSVKDMEKKRMRGIDETLKE